MEERVKMLPLQNHSDGRGGLIVAEARKDVPFDIKRLFYMYGIGPGTERGNHANRHSNFMLVQAAGSSRVRTDDGRGRREEFVLRDPCEGLCIPKMVWKVMYGFSTDSVLLVLSDEMYDAAEYIYDFQAFLREVSG